MLYRIKFKWIVLIGLLTACIDRITFDVPKIDSSLVVEGMITDQPGPYTVKISRSFGTSELAFSNMPVTDATVLLYGNEFLLDELTETEPGVYKTTGVSGIVGHTYYILIETKEGKHYVSEPELLRPVGDLTGIRAEFESRTVQTPDGEKNGDRFNIYVDGNTTNEPESFVRWRFTGTYFIMTHPELAFNVGPMGERVPTPAECSGYAPGGVDGIRYVHPCTCCSCWVTEKDKRWYVGASTEVSEEGYKDVFVGQAAITSLIFMDKYHVQVEQMSLSPKAHEFFRQLTAQADGVQSLFQPATGEIKGNISAINSDEKVLGFFYATSITSITKVLTPGDVPYVIPAPEVLRVPCTSTPGSSNVQPDFW